MTFTHCSHSTMAPGTCCRVLGRWDNRCGEPAAYSMDFIRADGTRVRHLRCQEHVGDDVYPGFETLPLGGAA